MMLSPLHLPEVFNNPEAQAAFEKTYGCKVIVKYKRSKKYEHEMMALRDAFILGWCMAKAPEKEPLPDWMK